MRYFWELWSGTFGDGLLKALVRNFGILRNFLTFTFMRSFGEVLLWTWWSTFRTLVRYFWKLLYGAFVNCGEVILGALVRRFGNFCAVLCEAFVRHFWDLWWDIFELWSVLLRTLVRHFLVRRFGEALWRTFSVRCFWELWWVHFWELTVFNRDWENKFWSPLRGPLFRCKLLHRMRYFWRFSCEIVSNKRNFVHEPFPSFVSNKTVHHELRGKFLSFVVRY